ncbi:uncharacterized protein LDX57_011862 [Aspergillus melleus]|uniref:uncharacterized protein n=1 Tax=Aspergillus melleus TaxID=138277 RepID=UPI001E8DA9F5|nr:uncharacterized protein LDX57_011862 [Aspergillus melleus]KAH8434224.1 hypothetical protein LDX57_011862 [Aspergillus melleus]
MEKRLRPSAPSFQPHADNCEVTRTQLTSAQLDDGSEGEELHESMLGLEERIVGRERQQRTVTHQSRAVSDARVRPVVPVPPAIPTQHPAPNVVATPFQAPRSGLFQHGQSGISPSSSNQQHQTLPFNPLNRSSGSIRIGAAHGKAPQELGPFAPETFPEHLSITDSRVKCKCPHLCEVFDAGATVSNISARLVDLYRRVGVWASVHANVPLHRWNSNLGPQAEEYLKGLADPSQLPALLSFPTTRHFLVAKAINYYLVRNILKVNIAGAFSTVASQEISEIQTQLAAGKPSEAEQAHPWGGLIICHSIVELSVLVRQIAVSAIISRTKRVLELPGFAAFIQGNYNTHVANLWQSVRPLSSDPRGSYQQARQELTNVVCEAQLLARDMYLAPFQYEFDFPVLDERFDPTTMVNHDPNLKGDPQVLKLNDYRVKLSVTPITRIRNVSVTPAEDTLVHWAQVLLKPAPYIG